jgi:hypothetical protein
MQDIIDLCVRMNTTGGLIGKELVKDENWVCLLRKGNACPERKCVTCSIYVVIDKEVKRAAITQGPLTTRLQNTNSNLYQEIKLS